MPRTFRLTLAQLNPTVGAFAANAAKARAAWAAGRDAGADMVALPEMFLTGYQTQDLVMKPAFVRDAMAAMAALAAECADGPALGIGGPLAEAGALFNAWWILEGGQVRHVLRKHHLPNSDVFDECRLFTPGPMPAPYALSAGGPRFGSPVCEDAWHPDVAAVLRDGGAELLLVPNGSPYRRDKLALRLEVARARVAETGLPLIYLNAVGGQDDQLFDGASFALDAQGRIVAQMAPFEEGLMHLDLRAGASGGWEIVPGTCAPQPEAIEQDYHAMVLGLRDYLGKSGFGKVLLGLSGGVDSALVAAVAADALGPEAVRCVLLPSAYTSPTSRADAEGVAARLGCRLDEVGIEGPRAAVTEALAPLLAGRAPGITEENIQSRLRGLLLMALSNSFGEMLLTTGNKSEMAVGYATIYGDMSGGYNPLKDLYKTRVFAACRWRNAHHRPWMMGPAAEVIPPRVIDKPPSAELRENQRDEDSLPPYEVLDAILERLIEGDQSVAEIVAAGFDRATVKRVEGLLYGAEWKRYQSAPGPRLTTRAFWLDRRYPMVNRWRDDS
ncbi:NAD+ synthase [Phaeovulum vinaykumarii]|uniref:Glutamine-dependent NAD(+) synthetase n=1 Tax=Phaeovulum vinaykumarii TaxID=407234 RepID=A0A1N7JNF2_9RHOB|nr:NAD+ synthase [Phaeovulum vinaykumarii]SIS50791.1 NAD+ synthase [Phaeovulum vinaykumarii]SOB90425.1 NAD+ synthase [Phaeovulum vinaykumarii]